MRNGRVTQCKLKFQVEEVLRYVIQFSMHIRWISLLEPRKFRLKGRNSRIDFVQDRV